MDLLKGPPEWFPKILEGTGRDILWWCVIGFVALIILLIIFAVGSKVLGFFSSNKAPAKRRRGEENLEEELGEYPALPPSTGDRQLLIEGVPVRLRLVVVAPVGENEIDTDEIEDLLEKVLPGLGAIAKRDKPRVRLWPSQHSYEGFTKLFHRNMLTPEGKNELSRWVTVAGRAKLGKFQVMLGVVLQAIKPTPLGRKTLGAHEWTSVFRIRVKD